MTEQRQYKLLDSVAMEALSAGIGLGTARPSKRPTPIETVAKIVEPPLAKATKRSWPQTIFAYLLDLLIIGGSSLIAVGVAHFATLEEIPMPADYLFILASRFEPSQIAFGILALLIAYFMLFKLLVGVTLGEALARSKKTKAG